MVAFICPPIVGVNSHLVISLLVTAFTPLHVTSER